MSTVVPATHRLLTTSEDAAQAREVLDSLTGPDGELFVAQHSEAPQALPVDLGRILQHVLEAMAAGSDVTVMAIPAELTTSAAAALLGISRPTLIKLAKEGSIASHRVGSHLRFRSEDIAAERAARREREREAFRQLRELEDD